MLKEELKDLKAEVDTKGISKVKDF